MLSNVSSRNAVAIGAVILAIGFAGISQAQQPSRASIAAAKEILVIKGARALFDPVVRGVVEQTRRTLLQTNIPLQKDIDEVSAALRREFEPRVSEMTDEVARTYATKFTEQELKELLAFYKSPLGRKAIVEEPKVIDQTMPFAAAWADKLADEVNNRFRVEMKKRGHDI
jgi:hypothetical protein